MLLVGYGTDDATGEKYWLMKKFVTFSLNSENVYLNLNLNFIKPMGDLMGY